MPASNFSNPWQPIPPLRDASASEVLADFEACEWLELYVSLDAEAAAAALAIEHELVKIQAKVHELSMEIKDWKSNFAPAPKFIDENIDKLRERFAFLKFREEQTRLCDFGLELRQVQKQIAQIDSSFAMKEKATIDIHRSDEMTRSDSDVILTYAPGMLKGWTKEKSEKIKELEEIRSRNRGLAESIRDAQAKLEELVEKDSGYHDAELAQLTAQLAAQELELADYERTRDERLKCIRNKAERLEGAEKTKNTLKSEIREESSKLEECGKKLKEVTEVAKERLQERVAELEKQVAEKPYVVAELRAKYEEITALDDKIAEKAGVDEAHVLASVDRDAHNTKLDEVSDLIVACRKTAKELSEQIAFAKTEKQKRREFDELRTTNEQLMKTIANLENELTKAESNKEETAKEVKNLREKYNNAQKENAKLNRLKLELPQQHANEIRQFEAEIEGYLQVYHAHNEQSLSESEDEVTY